MSDLAALLKRLEEPEFSMFRSEVGFISSCATEVAGKRIDTTRTTPELEQFRNAVRAYAARRCGLLAAQLEAPRRYICPTCKRALLEEQMSMLISFRWRRSSPASSPYYSECRLGWYCESCSTELLKSCGPGKERYCYPARKERKTFLAGDFQILVKRFDSWDPFPESATVEDLTANMVEAISGLNTLDFAKIALSLKLVVPPEIGYTAQDEGFPLVVVRSSTGDSAESLKIISATFDLC